jgi:hypothetical protein
MSLQLRHIFALLSMTAVSAATPVAAQDLFYFPLSARVASMGATGVADNATPSTIVINPANVLGESRLYVQGTDLKVDETFFNDLWMRRANAGATFQMGSARFGVDLAFSKLHSSLPANFLPYSQTFNEDLLVLTAGLGFVSGKNDFLFGVAAKRFTESLDSNISSGETESSDADVMAFDAGVEIRNHAALQGWDVNSGLGVALLNKGGDYEFDGSTREVRESWNFGLNVRMVSPTIGILSARVPMVAFLVNLDASQSHDDDWIWMAGTELAVAQMFFLRSGIRTFTGNDDQDPSDASWGMGVGIPAGKLRARLDYGRGNNLIVKDEHFELTVEWTL